MHRQAMDSAHLRVFIGGLVDVVRRGELMYLFSARFVSFPRVVPIFIHDEQTPTAAPLVVPVRLFARPSIPVTTEPGATARMTVGGRAYGPVTAGQDGRVRFDVLVEPGDKEAVVELEDSLGNKQTSSIVIGGIQGPTLAVAGQGSIIAGGLPPRAIVAVFAADGTPSRRAVPTCDGLIGDQLFRVGPGLWSGFVDTTVVKDKRVTCGTRSSETASLRVQVERSRATRRACYPPDSRRHSDRGSAGLSHQRCRERPPRRHQVERNSATSVSTKAKSQSFGAMTDQWRPPRVEMWLRHRGGDLRDQVVFGMWPSGVLLPPNPGVSCWTLGQSTRAVGPSTECRVGFALAISPRRL